MYEVKGDTTLVNKFKFALLPAALPLKMSWITVTDVLVYCNRLSIIIE